MVKIPLSNKTLYLFPDRMLIFTPSGVGAIGYEDLGFVITDKPFIEDQGVPRDAKVIGETWRYVNKNGTPDRRFRNNVRIPICQYEEVLLTSPSGLNEVIQLSTTGVTNHLDAAIQRLADVIASAATAPPATAIPVECDEPSRVRSPPAAGTMSQEPSGVPVEMTVFDSDRLHSVLIDILWCVMAVDGRASSAEKRRIHDIMAQMPGPWTDAVIDRRIGDFINEIRATGYRKALIRSLRDLQIFKDLGKQSFLIRCLDLVARADGRATERELELCQRIAKLMGYPEAQNT